MKHDRRTFLVQTVCAACRRVDIQLLSAGVPAAAAPPGAPATPLLHTNGAPATAPTTSPAASRSVNAVTCGFASLNLVPIAGHERPDGPDSFGIAVDLVTTTNSPNVLSALVAGSLDVVIVTTDAAWAAPDMASDIKHALRGRQRDTIRSRRPARNPEGSRPQWHDCRRFGHAWRRRYHCHALAAVGKRIEGPGLHDRANAGARERTAANEGTRYSDVIQLESQATLLREVGVRHPVSSEPMVRGRQAAFCAGRVILRRVSRAVHFHAGEYRQVRLCHAARLLVLGVGLCLGIQLASLRAALAAAPGGPLVTAQTTPLGGGSSTELALATALVDALNRGDEEGVVALFDPEATLRADRYAWTHHEIRRWARSQIAAAIVIEPEGTFQAIPNRAMWTARFGRVDWRQRGVEWVRMANQILTEGDRIIDFSADPLDGASVIPLGDLWRPRSTPDAASKSVGGPDLDDSGASGAAPAAPLALLACVVVVVVGSLVVSNARLLRARVTHGGKSHALISALAYWQRRRDVIG